MFSQFELASVALATVIDTVLLLALVERRNWRQVPLPILAIVTGAWLWHAGAFVRLLLFDLTGPWARPIHWLAVGVMTAGVLLVPCAMAHGCLRLLTNGLNLPSRPRPWFAVVYLPLLALVALPWYVTDDPRGSFIEITGPLRFPYAVWLNLVNFGSAACFWHVWRQLPIGRSRQFFALLAGIQLFNGVTQSTILFYGISHWLDWQQPMELAVLLTPTVLAVLFGYFVVRFNFMQLMLERTVVYATILAGVMLFHHFVFQGLQARLEDRFRVDFGILEAIVIVGLIVAYQPLRERAAEGLRYLFGARVAQTREQTRDLSTQLSSLAGREPRELLAWFCQAVERALKTEYVAAWLFDATHHPLTTAGTARLTDLQAGEIFRSMKGADAQIWTARSSAAQGQLLPIAAELAVRFDQPAATGLLVFGRRGGNSEFSQEEIGSIALLVEQLGIMLHNSWLQSQRLAAERRALQNEKLSTLGLLASSIAHEIKNPLSSIKTIAAVLAEDLGSDHPRAEDLRLILGEVDRLAQTTSQLLSFVRPTAAAGQPCCVRSVLESILSVMRHWARERGVEIDCCFDGDMPVAADESALREVLFNLLQNSIEAAGRGGRVRVECRVQQPAEAVDLSKAPPSVVIDIHDTGPGIAPEVQDRLFEPFVTTKTTGTGLGLYLVGQRIRDLGGEVRCRSAPGQGTLFTVVIPGAEK